MKRILAVPVLLIALAGCGAPELAVLQTEPTPQPTPTCPPVHPFGYPASDDSSAVPVPGCPSGYVPSVPTTTPTTSPVASAPTTTVTTTPGTSSAPPRDVPAGGPEPVYENCDEVRAAGAAPIYRGDPGFREKFDRDGDGVGCE